MKPAASLDLCSQAPFLFKLPRCVGLLLLRLEEFLQELGAINFRFERLRSWNGEPELCSRHFVGGGFKLDFHAYRADAKNASLYQEGSPPSVLISLNEGIGLPNGEDAVVRYIKKAVYHELIHHAQWQRMSAGEKHFYGRTREFYHLHPVEIMAHAGADVDELSRGGLSSEQILERLAAPRPDGSDFSYFSMPAGLVAKPELDLYLTYARQYATR